LRDNFTVQSAARIQARSGRGGPQILVAIYHMFSTKFATTNWGRLPGQAKQTPPHEKLVHRLERLGYTVTLEQKAA